MKAAVKLPHSKLRRLDFDRLTCKFHPLRCSYIAQSSKIYRISHLTCCYWVLELAFLTALI